MCHSYNVVFRNVGLVEMILTGKISVLSTGDKKLSVSTLANEGICFRNSPMTIIIINKFNKVSTV